jgi:Zn-dependent peptidase ImmA (M78 family)
VRLRRGFKTEANDIAREVRTELGLAAVDPLDPWALANHLAIPVTPLSAFAGEAPCAVTHFAKTNTSEFSAVTVFRGSTRVIVHNDSHVPGRQASNLSHELSHGLLLHQPRPPLDGSGCRDWDPDCEAEADWLGGALLVSEEAALAVVRRGESIRDAADRYGVSSKMMQFRINVTGAPARVRRARRPRGR